MTLPDKSPPRKPAKPPSRLGLYIPFGLLGVGVVAWSLGWLWLQGEIYRRMDTAAHAWEQAGYRVDWVSRSVSGYPFRLDVEIKAPRLRERSGWGLTAPSLKAEAFAFAPDHWVAVAPNGAVLIRRVGGPVSIAAKALRASMSDGAAHPPRLSIEGLGLTFVTPPGAQPFAFTRAGEFHFHSKAGPSDQGAAYLELDQARPAGTGWFRQIGGDSPVTFIADGLFTHAAALNGQGFSGALHNWQAAGGRWTVRRLTVRGAARSIEATSGDLAIGTDGRLTGTLPLTVKGGARLVEDLAQVSALPPESAKTAGALLAAGEKGGLAPLTAVFQAGETTLGPVGVGPAPRVY